MKNERATSGSRPVPGRPSRQVETPPDDDAPVIISAPARELPLHRHLVGNARQSWVHTLGHRCDGRGLGQEGPNR